MRTKTGTAEGEAALDLDLDSCLEQAGIARTIATYAPSAVIFSQGAPATDVFYLQQGSVKLSVLSRTGKEAVVAILGPGEFFGEGSLAGSRAAWRAPWR